MPDVVTGLVAGGTQLLGGILGSSAQESAASTAAGAQTAAAQMGIDEQRRQFDAIQELLKPYIETGLEAQKQQLGIMGQQGALLGTQGAEAQQAAIGQLESSPLFQAQVRQGEEALLQRASATGGLRGGNIQASLAQFRPQMLSQALQQQYSGLGGLAGAYGGISGLGQASAAGQAAAAQQTGANVSGLLGQVGQAQAGQALASGQAQANLYGNIGNLGGQYAGYQMLKGLGVF